MCVVFYQELKNTTASTNNLLNKTIVFGGSNIGRSNAHNLAILFAGGGFNDGQYIQYEKDKNEVFSKLFVSMGDKLKGVNLTNFKEEKQCLKEFI